MNPEFLLEIFRQVQAGKLAPSAAADRLRDLPYENLGHTRVDHHRSLRNGFPEVIYGEGKTTSQVLEIAQSLANKNQPVIVTRVVDTHARALLDRWPDADHHIEARMVVLKGPSPRSKTGCVAVISGGTSDMPVAEEAAISAETLGSYVERIYDIGVAGIHRLFSEMELISKANVIIAVAGMEGALPSVVAGLVKAPVIAVPTSVGYGTNLSGFTALFAMLNSCSDGISVVNIDNGFGAGFQAHLINQLASKI